MKIYSYICYHSIHYSNFYWPCCWSKYNFLLKIFYSLSSKDDRSIKYINFYWSYCWLKYNFLPKILFFTLEELSFANFIKEEENNNFIEFYIYSHTWSFYSIYVDQNIIFCRRYFILCPRRMIIVCQFYTRGRE